jgi:hypothetical protein
MNDLADLSIEDQKEFLLRYQLYVQYLRVFRKEDPSEIEKLESS